MAELGEEYYLDNNLPTQRYKLDKDIILIETTVYPLGHSGYNLKS